MCAFGSLSGDTVLVCSILAHDARHSVPVDLALISDMLGQLTDLRMCCCETDFAHG